MLLFIGSITPSFSQQSLATLAVFPIYIPYQTTIEQKLETVLLAFLRYKLINNVPVVEQQ